MKTTEPSIRVSVDLTNPGQFFACCGLIELADRLWPGAEGWFKKEEFCVVCGGMLNKVLDDLVDCHMTNTMTEAQHARFKDISAMSVKLRKNTPGVEDEYKALDKLLREANIVLRDPFHITLDWFADDYAGGSRFKTWAGRQSVLDIATSMKDALTNSAWRHEKCLTFSVTKCGLPFNFDSDLGGQGGAIDVGFSFDPLAGSTLTRIESMARPALELLAFIGLQRFRPGEIKGENRFLYTAWNRPLPIEVAMPAACGALPIIGADRFEFRLLYRTKYLKSFLPAIPFTGGSDE
jgi:CRISPR-associated protein Csb3